MINIKLKLTKEEYDFLGDFLDDGLHRELEIGEGQDFENYGVEPFRGGQSITRVGPGYGNRMQEQPFFPENWGYNRPKTYVDGEVVYNKNIDQHIIDDAYDAFGLQQFYGQPETTMPWAPQWDDTVY